VLVGVGSLRGALVQTERYIDAVQHSGHQFWFLVFYFFLSVCHESVVTECAILSKRLG